MYTENNWCRTLRIHRETRALRHKHQHNPDNEQHGQRCQKIAARDHAEIASPKRGGAFASSMTVTRTAHFSPFFGIVADVERADARQWL